MLKYYIKIISRNIIRNKKSTLLEISGLTIGLASFILLILFVGYELSYDKFNSKADRICRVAINIETSGTNTSSPGSVNMLADIFYEEFPEVELVCRLKRCKNIEVKYNENVFAEKNVFLSDSTLFNIFSFRFIKGNAQTALNSSGSVVISKKIARKYFADKDPLGKVIEIKDSENKYLMRITGVVEDMPYNSHFHGDIFMSIHNDPDIERRNWGETSYNTYILLHKGIDFKEANSKVYDLTIKYLYGGVEKYYTNSSSKWMYYLQPLLKIHLYSHLEDELEPNGNIIYVVVLLITAIFILVIACINFINLVTAKSTTRAKEIFNRKIAGGNKAHVIKLILFENIAKSFISLLLALCVIQIVLPYSRAFLNKPIEITYLDNFYTIPLLLLFALVIGFVSGLYPAFILSSYGYQAVTDTKQKTAGFRNVLVVFQFSLSIFLLISTTAIYKQLMFSQNQKLGFNKEHILVIKNPLGLGNKIAPFKNELLKNPGIQAVSASRYNIGQDYQAVTNNSENMKDFLLCYMYADPDFMKVMGFEMAYGRYFSNEIPYDSTAVVLNEAAVKLLKWDNAIGMYINNHSMNYGRYKKDYNHVIGVVKNFHFESKHEEIRPMGISFLNGIGPTPVNYILVRLAPGNIPETINFIRKTWENFSVQPVFEYSFFDEEYNMLYREEKKMEGFLLLFSILSIFVACLGVLGLASFIAENKIKEIGIRKVNGAKISEVLVMLNSSFIKWVSIAFVVAAPIAWYAMHRWLENFAYKTELSWWIFALAGVMALGVALLTVSWQSWKAATRNPVEALRYE